MEINFTKPKVWVKFILYAFIFINCTGVFGQSGSITGKVTDSKDNSGLVGVSVRVKGTASGTTANSDGIYKINGNQTIADTTYIVYDNNGNAIKFWDGHPNDNAFTQTTFDNYNNFTATVPYRVYFFTTPMYVPGMWVSPGKHNPVNYNYYNKGNYTYSYDYNSYGFPSSISSNAPFTYFSLKGVQYNSNEAYLYQYTKVN